MACDTTEELPAIDLLPLSDDIFLRAAQDIALIADGLMQCHDCPLLIVAVPSDAWGTTSPVIVCDDRLLPCPDRGRAVRERVSAPALEALCLASDALFARLRTWRWSGVRHPSLCAVTDGTGLMLVTDRREIAGAALFDIGGPRSPGAMILPPAPDGIWALLRADPRGASRH